MPGKRSPFMVRRFVNRHGLMFKVVRHRSGDVVVLAAHRGEVARWDAVESVGYLRSGGRPARLMERESWEEAVKVTAAAMRKDR
jgi:hypothetical protein